MIYRGQRGCCPGGICGDGDDSGYIYSSPAAGGGAGSQALTEQQTVVITEQQTVEITDQQTVEITDQQTVEITDQQTDSIPLLSLPSITVPTITGELGSAITSELDALNSAFTASDDNFLDAVSSRLDALSSALATATATPSRPTLGVGGEQSLPEDIAKMLRPRWWITAMVALVGAALAF